MRTKMALIALVVVNLIKFWHSEGVSDCSLTPTQQLFSCIMRTS